jgi:medium-chain acyl-[acyl-carrier-protein] hydrolase
VQPRHLFVSGRQAPSLREAERRTFDLPEAEFIEEVRRLRGTPAELLENLELMQLMLPLLRADFEICETYAHTPEPPFDCPMTIFGGISECASVEDLKAWREYTTGAFSIRRFPGDHFFLHTSQDSMLRVLAQELLKHLGSLKAEARA